MKRKAVSLLTLVLAVLLIFSACGGTEKPTQQTTEPTKAEATTDGTKAAAEPDVIDIFLL